MVPRRAVEMMHRHDGENRRVIAGAYAMGGPNFMAVESVNRIHTRPDELHRRKVLADRA